MAAYNAEKAKIAATLGTPQAQMLEKAAEGITTIAVTVAAPELAWTIPLAINAASGLLEANTPAATVAAVQQAVTTVSGVPAYHNIGVIAGQAIAAVAPANEAQQVAATQALATLVTQNLQKKLK